MGLVADAASRVEAHVRPEERAQVGRQVPGRTVVAGNDQRRPARDLAGFEQGRDQERAKRRGHESNLRRGGCLTGEPLELRALVCLIEKGLQRHLGTTNDRALRPGLVLGT